MKVFEIDRNQIGCPEGFIAYILRAPEQVFTGRAVEVKGSDGVPHVFYEGDASCQNPSYPGEVSRIFVKRDAPIDPAVYDMEIE